LNKNKTIYRKRKGKVIQGIHSFCFYFIKVFMWYISGVF